MEEAKKAAARSRPPRPDGGVVACVAVFQYCFKIGRVTIPPVSSVLTCYTGRTEGIAYCTVLLIPIANSGRAGARDPHDSIAGCW
jgi:hypothetical protein